MASIPNTPDNRPAARLRGAWWKRLGPAAGAVTKHQIKGNKMKIDTGSNIIISDLDAQTVTTINTAAKTYRISPITQPGAALSKSGIEMKVDVKDTGQQKRIGGFNCRQIIMSMTMTGQAMPMNMENEMWISSDVHGALRRVWCYEAASKDRQDLWQALQGFCCRVVLFRRTHRLRARFFPLRSRSTSTRGVRMSPPSQWKWATGCATRNSENPIRTWFC